MLIREENYILLIMLKPSIIDTDPFRKGRVKSYFIKS